MNQSKRNFLKVLPLVALTPAAIMLSETKAASYELKGDKKYLIVLPDSAETSQGEALRMKRLLNERGIDATLISGAENLKLYELNA